MAHDVKAFLPVKILDKQWAEKLLDGSVFMRSLFEFGAWNISAKAGGQTKEMDNAYRGDIHEGITKNIDLKTGDDYYNSFPPELRAVIANAWYIDDSLFKYLKIYSMYRLTYNLNTREFENPDKRLKDFGDTAVIIFNPDVFLRRVLQALIERFGDNVNFKMKEVLYFDISKDFGGFDIFWKTKWYEWQKELRMVIGLLGYNYSIINENGQILKPLIQDIAPLTLEIGDIQDIAVAISTKDLIKLNLPTIIDLPLDDYAL